MKRRTDWQLQQYRIRHEYAQKCALEAWEARCNEMARLRLPDTLVPAMRVVDLPVTVDDLGVALGRKH